MNSREIYAKPPVVLVAVEARHPDTSPLTDAHQSELKRLLAREFPLSQPQQSRTIVSTLGAPPTVTEATIPRFASRDQATAVTFGPQAVVVETTNHKSFEDLLGLVNTAIDARARIGEVDGLVRLGLRYVDEIRVPELSAAEGWREWIHASLVGPSDVGQAIGLVPRTWEGAVIFDRGEDRQLILRYGPREGFAVPPGGPLHRSTPAPGPFFLLDIDSFWTPSGEVPEFTASTVRDRCEDLHEPVSALFESLITEKLKREVLRHV